VVSYRVHRCITASISYNKEKKRGKHEKTSVTKRSKHQQNTDDAGQATGEEMRHVQMSM